MLQLQRVNKFLVFIRKSITHKELKLAIHMYNAIVRLNLEVCIQVWRPCHKKDIGSFKIIQRRASNTEILNVIPGKPFTSVSLAEELLLQHITIVGTLRKNKADIP